MALGASWLCSTPLSLQHANPHVLIPWQSLRRGSRSVQVTFQSSPCIRSINIPWARDFPGGPVVKTPRSHCRGPRVQSLVGELDPACWSPNLCATTETWGSQKQNKTKQKKPQHIPLAKAVRWSNQNPGMENYRIWEELKSLMKMDLDTGNGVELGPLKLQPTKGSEWQPWPDDGQTQEFLTESSKALIHKSCEEEVNISTGLLRLRLQAAVFSMLREGLLVAGGNETSIQREAETEQIRHMQERKSQLLRSPCSSYLVFADPSSI